MQARATSTFYDTCERVDRTAGEVFECTEARFAEINAAGYGCLVEAADEVQRTVKELRSILAENGVDVPKGARKSDLEDLVRGL